uniref:Uncharacterized protein n=1 Tax=Setaria viridis TaxID=4556 RepID=A0A4U6UTM5_SETVI|nr:hypothetical protein SEVIR_5G364148v2 [Setaria viridis]
MVLLNVPCRFMLGNSIPRGTGISLSCPALRYILPILRQCLKRCNCRIHKATLTQLLLHQQIHPSWIEVSMNLIDMRSMCKCHIAEFKETRVASFSTQLYQQEISSTDMAQLLFSEQHPLNE